MKSYDFVCWAFIVATSAAGVVPLVRQIPEVHQRMLEGIKPWVCDLCMSFWATLFATLFWWCWMNAPLVSIVPAFALTFFLVRKNSDPVGPAPTLPELEDMGGIDETQK